MAVTPVDNSASITDIIQRIQSGEIAPDSPQAAQMFARIKGGNLQDMVSQISGQPATAATRAAAPATGPVTGPPTPPNTVKVRVGGRDRTDLRPLEAETVIDHNADGTPIKAGDVLTRVDSDLKSGDGTKVRNANARLRHYGMEKTDPSGTGPAVYAMPASILDNAAQGGTGGVNGTSTSTTGTTYGSRLTSNGTAATVGGLAGLNTFSSGIGAGTPLGAIGGIGTMSALTGAGGVAGAMGMSGLQFQINKVVRSVASSYSDSQFIGMLHSGLNIESLLYYFMAYASDKYDKKLREKMEEWTLAQQAEDEMERNKSIASTISGVLSIAGPVGAAAGQVITAGADAYNRYSTALNGNMKSSTVLMQEVQILIQQWKTVNDLVSNLSKDINDMAMTTIRNLR